MSDFRDSVYHRYVSAFKGTAHSPAADAMAAWYAAKYYPLFHDLPPSAPVLDLGCGQGHFLNFLRQAGFSAVEGIDISAEQVAVAVEHGFNARAADAFEFLAAHPGRFQMIAALDFVEHFSKPELMRLLPLIHSALRADGLLLLQTPNGQGLLPGKIIYGDLSHMTILTPDSLRQLLRLNSFDAIHLYETGPAGKNLAGTLRLLLWRLVKLLANAVRIIETGKPNELWSENMICVCHKAQEPT